MMKIAVILSLIVSAYAVQHYRQQGEACTMRKFDTPSEETCSTTFHQLPNEGFLLCAPSTNTCELYELNEIKAIHASTLHEGSFMPIYRQEDPRFFEGIVQKAYDEFVKVRMDDTESFVNLDTLLHQLYTDRLIFMRELKTRANKYYYNDMRELVQHIRTLVISRYERTRTELPMKPDEKIRFDFPTLFNDDVVRKNKISGKEYRSRSTSIPNLITRPDIYVDHSECNETMESKSLKISNFIPNPALGEEEIIQVSHRPRSRSFSLDSTGSFIVGKDIIDKPAPKKTIVSSVKSLFNRKRRPSFIRSESKSTMSTDSSTSSRSERSEGYISKARRMICFSGICQSSLSKFN